jgi:gamma-glutamylcyclotransferase (GGCT)/AIG2-like uncharacterized protein YtfP
MTTSFLFVYGTLRHNSPHIMAQFLASKANFLGKGKTQGQLFNLGPYPGLVPSSLVDDQVCGDVFEVTDPQKTLERLDRYEGNVYERSLTNVVLENGQTLQAWVFYYRGKVEETQRIQSGIWRGQLA